MSWPTPQDYNEALQHPAASFRNEELRKGVAAVNALGLPKPVTGAFASVYRMHCDGMDWAVRCFLHNIPDQHARYTEISKFVLSDDLDFTVDCEFLKEGIRIGGQWYPILKMQWVEGLTLGEFLNSKIANHDTAAIEDLIGKFERAVQLMQQNGIAHGDLQHGNILVLPDGNIRLVDYDGMYVPSLQGWNSNELGHRNYQHPARSREHFGPYLDNFSAWVIYLSLLCVAIDPTLWAKTNAGDDCLLFRQRDYVNPKKSQVLKMLECHPSIDIRKAASMFESMLCETPAQLPGIEALGPDAQGKNFKRPSLFDRMVWNLKSLSFRVPNWLHDLKHENPYDANFVEPDDGHHETRGGLPGWLSNIVGERGTHNQDAGGNLSHTLNTSASAPPSSTPQNPNNKLPDWLLNQTTGSTSSTAHNPPSVPNHPPTTGSKPSATTGTNPPSLAGSHSPASTGPPPAMAGKAGASQSKQPNVDENVKRILSRARGLTLQHRYKEANALLIDALIVVPKQNIKLYCQVLVTLALTHAQHGDELYLARSSIAASEEYERSLHYLDTVSNLRGGRDAVADLMTKADVLNQLVSAYERRGDFPRSITACRRYITVLNQLPQTAEKLKRAKNKLKDLLDSTQP